MREVCKSAASGVVSSPFLTVQRMQYYPSGLPWADCMGADYQNRKYNGKEFIEMHGLDVTDLGNRGLYHAINRFTSIDRFAEKYPWQSPYVHAGNNPVNNIDINGDSISLAKMQRLDQKSNTNYTQTIIDDLQTQTGLTITVSTDGKMSYAKDINGQPIIVTTIDADGNTIQTGSTTARSLMIGAIDHQNWVDVVPAGKSGVPPGTNELRLSINQINKLINGAVNLDNRTLGWGMTFMHELHHTQIGGGLKDFPGNPGPVVDQVNIIRSELNALGGNYGQRLDYHATTIGSYKYIPFIVSTHSLINIGIIPVKKPQDHKFIQFK